MAAEFTKYIDVNYALGVMEKLISFQSNPELGYRTSGSAAEFAAADYLYQEMKRIGLKNVHKDVVTVDNFEFKHADLVYTMGSGLKKRVVLSAFQANCLAEDQHIKIVYVGKGRDVDYEGVDVAGKFVLVDIDMMEDWFIYWAVGQARTKKAASIIVVQVGGYATYTEDTLGVQDISTLADLPTFSMSVREAKRLKAELEAAGGEIEAVLNADVRVTNNGITHNVVGEIPGEVDEVIYFIGHYDGYFTAFSDNPSGIGCILGICRAFLASGYKPRRTIRVVMHGAEEWGIEGSRYDWARGATMEIRKHSEWARNGFLLLNMDGNLISGTATKAVVRTSYEMVDGVQKIGEQIEGSIYPFGTMSPLWTWTESYMYAMLGIPTVETGYEGVYFWDSYHSTADTREANDYSDEAFFSSHVLYGSLLQEFDKLDTRPVDFTALLDKLTESIEHEYMKDTEKLEAAVAKARAAAVKVNEKAASLKGLGEDTRTFNTKLSRVCAKVVNDLFGLDWYENYDFIHARNRNNVKLLEAVLADLEAGDLDKAINEDLRGVDLCWYAYNFDRETYDFFVDQVIGDSMVDTWAVGKVNTITDLYDTCRVLLKARAEGTPVPECAVAKLSEELEKQREELLAKQEREAALLEEMTVLMEDCLA